MTVAAFSLPDSLGKVRFFEETFLLADTSMKVVLGMPFLALSNADIQFGAERLTWRSYTAAEALPTARRVELIDKHEFAKAALDENSETFVVHVAALEAPEPTVQPSRAPLLAALQQDKAPTEISPEYSDYADVFSFDLAMEPSENAIEFVGGKQPPCGPICSLSPVELETLKTYIETHLKTGFICPLSPLQVHPSFLIKSPMAASACVLTAEA